MSALHVAILGTRGIPASYSGFETSVQETAVRFVRRGIHTTVYCRSNHYNEKREEYNGVTLVYQPSVKSKHLDTIIHTFLSVVHALPRKYDIILLYGIGNSIFIPILRIFSKPVISIVDGADWERMKWGRIARRFLSINRRIAARFSTYYVVDNESLAEDYERVFRRSPVYIPYGANMLNEYEPNVLNRFNLKEREYIIFVGRFVKEKAVDFLIQNFRLVATGITLVLVGDNPTDQEYVNSLRQTADERILFTGFLYGGEYESLLHKALFYVSCSFLEGTSPSLLSAMAINGFALVSDLAENREVLKGSCAVFKTGDGPDFREKLSYYLTHWNLVEDQREITKKIVSAHYDWDVISDKYIQLFSEIVSSGGDQNGS
ncbi:glycosyltransferase [Gemmatimonadota bacterium]